MPDGKTHDIITVVTAVAADGLYAQRAASPDFTAAALFTVAFVAAGFACAGDLDLDSREYRRWGPLRILWWPYRMLVPHRSRVSHGLFLGGLIRALYLGASISLLAWIVLTAAHRIGMSTDPDREIRRDWHSLFGFAQVHPQWAGALFLGFVLAGTAHSLADIIWTGIRRRV